MEANDIHHSLVKFIKVKGITCIIYTNRAALVFTNIMLHVLLYFAFTLIG